MERACAIERLKKGVFPDGFVEMYPKEVRIYIFLFFFFTTPLLIDSFDFFLLIVGTYSVDDGQRTGTSTECRTVIRIRVIFTSIRRCELCFFSYLFFHISCMDWKQIEGLTLDAYMYI